MIIKYLISVISILTVCNLSSAQNNSITAHETPDSLNTTYEELDEFVLTMKKELVKSDGAKMTYDMEADDSSKGQSLLDAIRKIPMVTVDGQDNIYIKGSQNFKIYVNGKEDPMLTANASKVLKAMPADAVSKVEVITEPGAKYDAEGVGGVLNLVTERKQSKDGYTGSVSLTATSQNSGASLYGRMKNDKITADASINFFDNSWQKQSNQTHSETWDYVSQDMYKTEDYLTQSVKFNYVGANLNLSWEPTDKDLFTIGGNVNSVSANIGKLEDLNIIYTNSGEISVITLQKIKGSMSNLGASGNASYRRIFSDMGNSLTFAYRFNYGYNPFKLDYENENIAGEDRVMPYQKSHNITYQREHTVTADYSDSFLEDKHKIEAGLKGVFRINSQNTAQFTGLSPDEYIPVNEDSGLIRQIQDIYAAYVSYSGAFGSFSLTAGLRYEHTYMGLDFPQDNYSDFRRHLNDIVPNAALTYMFSPASNIRLAYQMRINRPSVTQLNPAIFQMTQTIAQVGNPELESEHYNNVSLTYSNFGQQIGGNIGINLFQSNNTIERYTFYKNGVAYESYGNFGKNKKAELSGFINWNISGKMSLSFNGSVNYTIIKSGDGLFGNHGWEGNYGVNYNYTGPWNIKYSAYGGQSTGNVRLQGRFSGWYYYGLGISRNFLKNDMMNLSLTASNFFTKYSHFRTETWTETHYSVSRFKNRSWNIGITLTLNFGQLNDRVKRTNAKLENNDTKSVGNGNSQSGLGF